MAYGRDIELTAFVRDSGVPWVCLLLELQNMTIIG